MNLNFRQLLILLGVEMGFVLAVGCLCIIASR